MKTCVDLGGWLLLLASLIWTCSGQEPGIRGDPTAGALEGEFLDRHEPSCGVSGGLDLIVPPPKFKNSVILLAPCFIFPLGPDNTVE